MRRHPNSQLLSFYCVKQLVENLSGVTSIDRDMCVNSCIGYTGPYAELDSCPHCRESRYELGKNGQPSKKPRKQFSTIPLGPQLQALWRTPEGAQSLHYRQKCTESILEELQENGGARTSASKDFFDGYDYLNAVKKGRITEDDMVLVLSIDGAQLY